MFVVHRAFIPHCRARLKKQKFKPFRHLDFYFSKTPVLEENKPSPLLRLSQRPRNPVRIP
ncbi:hypothetical protein CFBP6626_05380 [Agrobacterium tumefaciens]|nr:hypothetical protein CFBP6626_05380 [Agrobacterium tumefaciens]